jgi:hypothetical protein
MTLSVFRGRRVCTGVFLTCHLVAKIILKYLEIMNKVLERVLGFVTI